jgi:hypothetical protein
VIDLHAIKRPSLSNLIRTPHAVHTPTSSSKDYQ